MLLHCSASPRVQGTIKHSQFTPCKRHRTPFKVHATHKHADQPLDASSTSAASKQDNNAVASMQRRGLVAAAVVAALAGTGALGPLQGPLGPRPAAAEELALLPTTSAAQLNSNELRVLEINQRVQAQNSAPKDFPTFVRTGYNVKVLGDDYTIREDGLIYKDFEEGTGPFPQQGQEATFQYIAYNESGLRIDSTYLRGRPAQTRIGIGGLIPGFAEGLKTMRLGGKRRIVVPPELGPPVGPATFFSAKQFEVFDVELVKLRNCERTQSLMFSSVVCEDI